MEKFETLNKVELKETLGGSKGKRRNWNCDLGVTAGILTGAVLSLGNPWGGVAGGLGAASTFCF
ncbi:MAG: Blp family class II bacteriocin [Holdemanella porci]